MERRIGDSTLAVQSDCESSSPVWFGDGRAGRPASVGKLQRAQQFPTPLDGSLVTGGPVHGDQSVRGGLDPGLLAREKSPAAIGILRRTQEVELRLHHRSTGSRNLKLSTVSTGMWTFFFPVMTAAMVPAPAPAPAPIAAPAGPPATAPIVAPV